jgi:hypothetical protein
MADSRLILLDLNERHRLLESNIGRRVQYITNRNTYLAEIQNAMMIYRRIDLFLSSADRNLIGNNNLPLFNNIYFHLYCPTVDDVRNNQILLPFQAYVQVFEENILWLRISYSILTHDLTRLTENYSREARETYETTQRIVLEEVEAAKFGVQPQ